MKTSAVIVLLAAFLGQAQAGNLRANQMERGLSTAAPTEGGTEMGTEMGSTMDPSTAMPTGDMMMKQMSSMSPSMDGTDMGTTANPDTESPTTEAPTEGDMM